MFGWGWGRSLSAACTWPRPALSGSAGWDGGCRSLSQGPALGLWCLPQHWPAGQECPGSLAGHVPEWLVTSVSWVLGAKVEAVHCLWAQTGVRGRLMRAGAVGRGASLGRASGRPPTGREGPAWGRAREDGLKLKVPPLPRPLAPEARSWRRPLSRALGQVGPAARAKPPTRRPRPRAWASRAGTSEVPGKRVLSGVFDHRCGRQTSG